MSGCCSFLNWDLRLRTLNFELRALLLATCLFKITAEQGFAGTSVRDIAEAANVNLAMISYYFGSKEKLMEAMFHHRGWDFKIQLENILQNKNLSPMQKVEKLIDDYIERIFRKQCFHKVMTREQMNI